MVVDEDGEPVSVIARMAGYMDLTHELPRQSVHVGYGIETQVVGRDVDIVHVTEKPTAGSPYELGQELGLRNGRMPEAEIARRILDEDLPTKRDLGLVDVPANYLETLFRVRQREKMIQVHPACDAPGQVLRHQHGLDALDQRREPLQMAFVQANCPPERESDAVERNWILGSEMVEPSQRRTPSQVILRVNLEPGDGRASGDDLLDVGRAQPDAGRRRRASYVSIASGHPDTRRPVAWRAPPLRLLGLEAAVHALLAGALGDVHPGIALLVPLGGARTGRIGRLAVVLGCPRGAQAEMASRTHPHEHVTRQAAALSGTCPSF